MGPIEGYLGHIVHSLSLSLSCKICHASANPDILIIRMAGYTDGSGQVSIPMLDLREYDDFTEQLRSSDGTSDIIKLLNSFPY